MSQSTIQLVLWGSWVPVVAVCEHCRARASDMPDQQRVGTWFYDAASVNFMEAPSGDYCDFCASAMFAAGTAVDITAHPDLEQILRRQPHPT